MVDDNAIKWKKSGGTKRASVNELDVEMRETDGRIMLSIGGVEVAVEMLANEKYFVDTFQFQTFENIDDLVHKLIRKELELREEVK